MDRIDGYGGIDRFRLVAALLIVGIHTFPFTSISEELNFFIINVFARIAVPFFLMSTGYFLLHRYLGAKNSDKKPLYNSIKKTVLIYAGATLVYFPISVYAGYYSESSFIAGLFRNIVFDGTFYHLWYLPASIIGVLLLYILSRRFSLRVILAIASVLYIAGLPGDSYYGIVSEIPLIKSIYDAAFNIFTYTRNGLFYAPIFLAMGAAIAKMERQMKPALCILGFVVSMSLMLLEGYMLNSFSYQRHDSMYIMLIPSMFFLFTFILTLKGKASSGFRDMSMWIYVVHPLFIIVVRGAARFAGLSELFVDNSIVHYMAVCVLSLVFSYICVLIQARMRKRVTSNK